MPIEPHTFQQIIKLTPPDIFELVETVGTAAQLNIHLIASQQDKIAIACVMLSHANTMLEQCKCTVETIIDNPNWISPAIYKTEMDGMKGIL